MPIVQGFERWILCTSVSVNVSVTLATEQYLNIIAKHFLKHPVF
jgi:hypothetical protein